MPPHPSTLPYLADQPTLYPFDIFGTIHFLTSGEMFFLGACIVSALIATAILIKSTQK